MWLFYTHNSYQRLSYQKEMLGRNFWDSKSSEKYGTNECIPQAIFAESVWKKKAKSNVFHQKKSSKKSRNILTLNWISFGSKKCVLSCRLFRSFVLMWVICILFLFTVRYDHWVECISSEWIFFHNNANGWGKVKEMFN